MSADNWAVCPDCGDRFREDWEIGVEGRELFIDYRGACRACDLRVIFRHTEPVGNGDLTSRPCDRCAPRPTEGTP